MQHEYKVTIEKTLLGAYLGTKMANFDCVFSFKWENTFPSLDLNEIEKDFFLNCIPRMQSEQNNDHKEHEMLNL